MPRRSLTRGTLALVALLSAASYSGATTIIFNDFSSTAGLTLTGSANAPVVTGDGSVLRLTPALTTQSGSAFGTSTINASTFSTYFTFRISNRGGISDGTAVGADGLVFVIQPVSASIGGAGGGIGYAGISPSVGVEFDTFHNGWDPSSNHLGIDLNGSITSVSTLNVSPSFDDGNIWHAWIDYDGTTLEVRTNQTGVRPVAATFSYNLDIPTIIGTNSAFVGFTAGTGSAYGNHDILSWEYRDEFNPIGPAVPEPSTFAIFGMFLALGAGCWLYRRQRAAALAMTSI